MAEMQEDREKYKQKNVACEEKILTLTRENAIKKKGEQSTDRGVYHLLKCHVVLYGIMLIMSTLKSKIMVEKIHQELIALWNRIYNLQYWVYHKYFDSYINKTIYLIATCILLLFATMILIYRVLSFRTTMWKFYYANKGVENRSKDRITIICLSEYIASAFFIVADKVLCNYMVLKWLSLTFIAGTLLYAPKVIRAYYKRLITQNK